MTALGQENQDRTTVAGQLGQDSCGRIVKTGQLGQVNLNRLASQVSLDIRLGRLRGQDS
jgi:hypothetical protein